MGSVTASAEVTVAYLVRPDGERPCSPLGSSWSRGNGGPLDAENAPSLLRTIEHSQSSFDMRDLCSPGEWRAALRMASWTRNGAGSVTGRRSSRYGAHPVQDRALHRPPAVALVATVAVISLVVAIAILDFPKN
jgi:hypothetical protein